jgi:Na+/H+-translocating membrane pyrophosphatase
MLCGFIGMFIATYSNTKVTYMAQSSLGEAFKLAYRAGTSIGFIITGIAILNISILIVVYLALPICP